MLNIELPWELLNITKDEYYNSYCYFCRKPTKHEECQGHYFTLDMKNRFMENKRFIQDAQFEM